MGAAPLQCIFLIWGQSTRLQEIPLENRTLLQGIRTRRVQNRFRTMWKKTHERKSQQGCRAGGCSLSFARPPEDKEKRKDARKSAKKDKDPVTQSGVGARPREQGARGRVWDTFHGQSGTGQSLTKFPATSSCPSCCLQGNGGCGGSPSTVLVGLAWSMELR